MTDKDWAEIWDSYNFLLKSAMTKVEGPNWIIYKVGTNVIRVDIKL